MVLLDFLNYILFIYTQGCLNDKGTYQINVKIYADYESKKNITNYTYSNLPHKHASNLYHHSDDFIRSHIKHYFGTIFNEVNKSLKGTNVQFIADFSDLFKHEFKELHSRYCGYNRTIIDMTEDFLNDFDDRYSSGENKIIIIDCKHNDPFMSKETHLATKNNCGKVFGVLNSDPEIMKNLIFQGLHNIFSSKSISKVIGIHTEDKADVCSYINSCNRNFDGNGKFVQDLGILHHKVLSDGEISGFGYNIAHHFYRNFADNHHFDDIDPISSHYVKYNSHHDNLYHGKHDYKHNDEYDDWH